MNKILESLYDDPGYTITELANMMKMSRKSISNNIKKLKLFLNGVQLSRKEQDGVFKIYNNNKFIGIGCINNHLLKRDIIVI